MLPKDCRHRKYKMNIKSNYVLHTITVCRSHESFKSLVTSRATRIPLASPIMSFTGCPLSSSKSQTTEATRTTKCGPQHHAALHTIPLARQVAKSKTGVSLITSMIAPVRWSKAVLRRNMFLRTDSDLKRKRNVGSGLSSVSYLHDWIRRCCFKYNKKLSSYISINISLLLVCSYVLICSPVSSVPFA